MREANVFWQFRRPGEGLLCRTSDGQLVFAAENDAELVPLLAAGSAEMGLYLIEALDWEVSTADGTFVDGPIQGWRRVQQNVDLGEWTDAKGDVIRLSNGDVANFTLEPRNYPERASLLARLPSSIRLDQQGLTEIIRTGDAVLLPVAQAVLKLLDAAEARQAWNTCPRGPAQDAFFPALQAHGRERLQRFGSYTADVLRVQAATYGWSIGDKTYGRPTLIEAERGKLTIGRFCSMADPTIILGNHSTRSASSYPFLEMWTEWPGTTIDLVDHVARDVWIGNDVWIGIGSIILPGAIIGDGAVIGAGSVVRGNVPSYGIFFGNPGKVERYRCDERSISRLLRLRWWDWPDGKIDRYIRLLLSPNLEDFLQVAESELEIPTLELPPLDVPIRMSKFSR